MAPLLPHALLPIATFVTVYNDTCDAKPRFKPHLQESFAGGQYGHASGCQSVPWEQGIGIQGGRCQGDQAERESRRLTYADFWDLQGHSSRVECDFQ